MDGTAPPELVSLLSASSYPVPEPPHGLRFQGDGPSISEPITVSGSTPGTRPTNQAMGPAAVHLTNPAGSSTTPGTPSNRRGRPRKPLGENVAMTYEEVRKMLIFLFLSPAVIFSPELNLSTLLTPTACTATSDAGSDCTACLSITKRSDPLELPG